MNFDDPMQLGLLQFGLGALAASGPRPYRQTFGAGLAEAGQQGLKAYQQQKDRLAEEEERKAARLLRDLQMKKLQDAMKQEELMGQAARASYQSPLGEANEAAFASTGLPLGRVENAEPQALASKTATGGISLDSFLANAIRMGVNPLQATQMAQALRKTDAPMILSADAIAVDSKGRTVASNVRPPKPPTEPNSYREWRLAGSPGTYANWLERQNRARGNNVTVMPPGDRAWLSKITEDVSNSAKTARGSVGTINTLSRMRDVIESGNINVGPGATIQQVFGQLSVKSGVAGRDEAEKVANTRTLIQASAQVGLDAAKQLQGQGQISDYERKSVEKAAVSGVDSLSIPEFKALVRALDAVNRFNIRQHQTLMRGIPEEMSGFSGFYDVQMPPELEPFSEYKETVVEPKRPINAPVIWGR